MIERLKAFLKWTGQGPNIRSVFFHAVQSFLQTLLPGLLGVEGWIAGASWSLGWGLSREAAQQEIWGWNSKSTWDFLGHVIGVSLASVILYLIHFAR